MAKKYRLLKHGEKIKKGDEKQAYRPDDFDLIRAVWLPVSHFLYGCKHNSVNSNVRRPITQSINFILEGER